MGNSESGLALVVFESVWGCEPCAHFQDPTRLDINRVTDRMLDSPGRDAVTLLVGLAFAPLDLLPTDCKVTRNAASPGSFVEP